MFILEITHESLNAVLHEKNINLIPVPCNKSLNKIGMTTEVYAVQTIDYKIG